MRAVVVLFTIVALMVVAVMPLGVALGQDGEVNPVRALPDGTVYGGETFNVTVTFTSPTDQFNNAVLIDFAPDGWNVTVDKAWCTPNADSGSAAGNRASFTWTGPYSGGTNFTALYKVTVPNDAEPKNYNFIGLLGYYLELEPSVHQSDPIAGDFQVEVVLRPEISFSPSNLSFSAVKDGANPANQTLEIWNTGGETLNWSLTDDADWLSEMPMSGSSTGPSDNTSVAVSVNITGMPAGNYTANITITAPGASNTSEVVPVSLHISLAPKISFSPPSLSFSAIQGGANPGNQTLEIWNLGGGLLNWTVSDDADYEGHDWLSENPTSGSSTGPSDNTSVNVAVNIAGMFAGDYLANITINAPGRAILQRLSR